MAKTQLALTVVTPSVDAAHVCDGKAVLLSALD